MKDTGSRVCWQVNGIGSQGSGAGTETLDPKAFSGLEKPFTSQFDDSERSGPSPVQGEGITISRSVGRIGKPLFKINGIPFDFIISFLEGGYHILDFRSGLVESDCCGVSLDVGFDFQHPFDPLQDKTYPVGCGRSITAGHMEFDNPCGVRIRSGCTCVQQQEGHHKNRFQRFHS